MKRCFNFRNAAAPVIDSDCQNTQYGGGGSRCQHEKLYGYVRFFWRGWKPKRCNKLHYVREWSSPGLVWGPIDISSTTPTTWISPSCTAASAWVLPHSCREIAFAGQYLSIIYSKKWARHAKCTWSSWQYSPLQDSSSIPCPHPTTPHDVWDSEHVRLPWSKENLYPQEQEGRKVLASRCQCSAPNSIVFIWVQVAASCQCPDLSPNHLQ